MSLVTNYVLTNSNNRPASQKTRIGFALGSINEEAWCLCRYGFETTNLSLPLRVFELFDSSNSQGVDLVSQTWNQLYPWVFESSEAIVGVRGMEKRVGFA